MVARLVHQLGGGLEFVDFLGSSHLGFISERHRVFLQHQSFAQLRPWNFLGKRRPESSSTSWGRVFLHHIPNGEGARNAGAFDDVVGHFGVIFVASVSALVAASWRIFSRLEGSSLRILGATSWMGDLSLLPEFVDLFHRRDKSADLSSLVVRVGGHSLVLAEMHHLRSHRFPQIIVFVLLITLLRVVSYLLHATFANSCHGPPRCLDAFNVIFFTPSLSAVTASL